MNWQLGEPDGFKILGTRRLQNLSLLKSAYFQGWQSPSHSHENARLVYVLRGAFSENYGAKKRECAPFTTIFRPPLETHSENYYGKGIVCLSVDIEPGWLASLHQYGINLDRSAAYSSRELVSLITRLNTEFDNLDNISALAIETLMLEIAIEIARPERTMSSKAGMPRWLLNARDYICAEFTSDLKVSEIAKAANVHPVHLTRVFQKAYGCTIVEYIQRLRIDLACSMIATTNKPLAEIAVMAGFSDQSHFCRTFKRLVKLTPAQYRTAVFSR